MLSSVLTSSKQWTDQAMRVNLCSVMLNICFHDVTYLMNTLLFEPRREKTEIRGLQPGPTQTGLYSHSRRLEA